MSPLAAYRAEEQPYHLYRCYDSDDRLLYIGCTAYMQNRMVVHRIDKKSTASALLRQFMVRHEVVTYRGQSAGLAAERAAIRAEQPIFNYQNRGLSHSARNREIADYICTRTGRRPAAIDVVSLNEFFEETAA